MTPTPFNIEAHTRYVPTRPRREAKPRRANKPPEKPAPNYSGRTTPSCYALHGNPCRCKRMSGTCVQCRREVTVSVGERATPALAHDRGRLIGYVCVRCR